jgi:hypothetical protein
VRKSTVNYKERQHSYNPSAILHVNAEINKIAIWFRANRLAVNISKTKYIIFRLKGKNIGPNTPAVVFNENEQITAPADPNLITTLERYHDDHPDTNCRAYKLLGIYLDEHLTLNSHTNHVVNKLSRLYTVLNKLNT